MNEKILLITGISLVLLQFVLSLPVFIKAVHPSMTIDFFKLVAIGIGIVMCILGSSMPNAARNSMIGLRTKWSLQSDSTWNKSHSLGGSLLSIFGLFSLFICGLCSGVVCIYVSIAILFLAMTISIYITYKIAKTEI